MSAELDRCRESVSKISRTRAIQKLKLTLLIDRLREYKLNNALTKDIFNNQNVTISEVINSIKVSDEKIVDLFEEYDVESLDSDLVRKADRIPGFLSFQYWRRQSRVF